ncbi:MAG TPA: hypothetical protein VG965_00720 [Patescibacteria group bacterium]|nr:hypothetical protein [Patescibacteria group bacterium]
MNKKVAIIVAVVLVLIVAVAAFMMMKKGAPKASTTSTSEEQTAVPTSANIISSIRDALARSETLECSFTTDSGISTHAYIKSGMIRADVTGKTSNESGSMIMKDKKMYFWNSQMAITMQVPDVTVTPGASQGSAQYQNTMDSLEAYKKDCHAATVADSEFDLPTGVTFKDMSSMMKEMAPGGAAGSKRDVPSGVVVPSNYQEMMQKYAPKSQ